MPSPAETPTPLERALRILAGIALGWLLVRAFGARPEPVQSSAVSSELGPALDRWSGPSAPAGVHVVGDGGWEPWHRDWLAALGGAGTRVTWDGLGAAASAIAADPVADPERATGVRVGSPGGAIVAVGDAVGPVDSLRVSGGGARFLLRSGPRWVRLLTPAGRAASRVEDSLVLGRILLLARGGWESKFVAASLEERGWGVDARLVIAPRAVVHQGSPAPIDTARTAAVIVLDSGVADARAIAGFVRNGGGLILSAAAAKDPGLAPLSAALPGDILPGREPFDTQAVEPRGSLALIGLRERRDAIVLERRGAITAVAARRADWGRVITVGYQDSWRWRLAGSGEAVAAHRDWWADLVASVARTGRLSVATTGSADEAPLVSLLDRLGPPEPRPAGERGPMISDALLFAALLGALLVEWGSRRLRGAV